MTDGYPFWKFCCERWLSGKINAFELDEQGLFLHLCMRVWAGGGSADVCSTLVERQFRKPAGWCSETVKAFADCGIIYRNGSGWRIKFMDEQLSELGDIRVKRIQAGRMSAEARRREKSPPSPPPRVEETRVEERRGEERVEHPATSVQHVLNTTPQPPPAGERAPDEPARKKSEPVDYSQAVIPEALSSQAGFADAWAAWMEARRGKGARATRHAQELLLRKLAERPGEAVRACEVATVRVWRGFEWEWLERNRSGNGSGGYEPRSLIQGMGTGGL